MSNLNMPEKVNQFNMKSSYSESEPIRLPKSSNSILPCIIINFIVQGFSFFFQNNIKLIEMISVYFNTILDSYYQDKLVSSNCL